MLYIFGGLPGTGKSTLSSALARHFNAFYLRIDTIEQALRDCDLEGDGPAGYVVGYGLALENLRLGLSVVADSVNPLDLTRRAWREVALQAQVPFVEIEVICSDTAEHRARVESRRATIVNLKLPQWTDVIERHYEKWEEPHIVTDTAGYSVGQSVAHLFATLDRTNDLVSTPRR